MLDTLHLEFGFRHYGSIPSCRSNLDRRGLLCPRLYRSPFTGVDHCVVILCWEVNLGPRMLHTRTCVMSFPSELNVHLLIGSNRVVLSCRMSIALGSGRGHGKLR